MAFCAQFAALLMLRLERERHLRAKEVANAWKRQQSIASAMRKASMGRKADAGQGSFRKLKSLLSIRASSRSRLQGPSEAQFRIAAQFLDTGEMRTGTAAPACRAELWFDSASYRSSPLGGAPLAACRGLLPVLALPQSPSRRSTSSGTRPPVRAPCRAFAPELR